MWPGKSFDTHGPIGPWIVTADEFNPTDAKIRTWVDFLRDELPATLAADQAALRKVVST